MFCKKCGKEISDNATFCEYCGNKVEVQSQIDKIVDGKSNKFSIANKKFLVVIIPIVIIGIIASALSMFNSPKEVLYGLKWGSTYEEVLKVDKGTEEPSSNSGTNYVSSNNVNPKYFGFSKNDFECKAHYSFGSDNSLHTILIAIYTENAKISDEQIIKGFIDYYNDACEVDPVENEYSFGLTWKTDSNQIKLGYPMEDMFTISITPNI